METLTQRIDDAKRKIAFFETMLVISAKSQMRKESYLTAYRELLAQLEKQLTDAKL